MRTGEVTSRLFPASGPSGTGPERVQVAAWGVALFVMLALIARHFTANQVGLYVDDRDYALLARAISRAEPYHAALRDAARIPQFPPGFPLLLAPLVLAFPRNVDALRSISLLATVINAALLFWGGTWLMPRSRHCSLAAAVLYMFSSTTVEFARSVNSEPVFTTFCLGALILAQQVRRGRNEPWRLFLLAGMLLCAVLTRTIGWVLIPAVILSFCFGPLRVAPLRMVSLGVIMAFLTAGLLVSVTSITLLDLLPTEYLRINQNIYAAPPVHMTPVSPRGGAEGFFVRGVVAALPVVPPPAFVIVADAIEHHVEFDVATVVLPVRPEAIQMWFQRLGIFPLAPLPGSVITLLILIGLFRWLRAEPWSPLTLFVVLYNGVLTVWLWRQPRFLLPIQPVLVPALLIGVQSVVFTVTRRTYARQDAARWAQRVVAAMGVVVLTLNVGLSLRSRNSRDHCGDFALRSAWLRDNTTPNTVVLTEDVILDTFYSQRRCIAYPRLPCSEADMERDIAQNGIGFILVAPSDYWQERYSSAYSEATKGVLPSIAALQKRGRIAIAYDGQGSKIRVYRVLRTGGRP